MECIAVTGTITDATATQSKHQADGTRHEKDGDTHGWLKVDSGFENLINSGNMKDENGNLVFEIICRFPVTQTDAKAACQGYADHISVPPVGSHVRIVGRYGDIEKRTGLLRCYISRVENGHTVPAIETLEKPARALEMPLYQLFCEGQEPPKLPNVLKRKSSDDNAWGSVGKDARYLSKIRRVLAKIDEGNRKLLLDMTQKMSNR